MFSGTNIPLLPLATKGYDLRGTSQDIAYKLNKHKKKQLYYIYYILSCTSVFKVYLKIN